jgi:hypothetical protein
MLLNFIMPVQPNRLHLSSGLTPNSVFVILSSTSTFMMIPIESSFLWTISNVTCFFFSRSSLIYGHAQYHLPYMAPTYLKTTSNFIYYCNLSDLTLNPLVKFFDITYLTVIIRIIFWKYLRALTAFLYCVVERELF